MRAALRPKLRRCLRELLNSMLYGPLARPLVAAGPVASGPYSIVRLVPAANSTLGARGPADLSTITQTAAHTVAQIEFSGNALTHVRAHCYRLRPLKVWRSFHPTPSSVFLPGAGARIGTNSTISGTCIFPIGPFRDFFEVE